MSLLTSSDLDEIDVSGMYKIYDKWPEFARRAYESNYEEISLDNFDHLVFAGMGGSGSIGDIFSGLLSQSNIHVDVVKGYNLPKTITKNSLIVTTSVSGNTDETLTILQKAQNLDCSTLAFSDGGKVKQFCEKNKIVFCHIPKIHSPRASLPNFLYGALSTLNSLVPLSPQEITDSLKSLEYTQKKISSANLSLENPSLKLAYSIKGIPFIYYPWGLKSTAIRFKNSLQENAKIHVIAEDLIESCHNGIVPWEKPSIVFPILIQGIDDNLKTKERWKVLKNYFISKNIDFYETISISGNILSKIINMIYVLDYSSLFYSIIQKIDPTPVNAIDYIKNQLNSS